MYKLYDCIDGKLLTQTKDISVLEEFGINNARNLKDKKLWASRYWVGEFKSPPLLSNQDKFGLLLKSLHLRESDLNKTFLAELEIIYNLLGSYKIDENWFWERIRCIGIVQFVGNMQE